MGFLLILIHTLVKLDKLVDSFFLFRQSGINLLYFNYILKIIILMYCLRQILSCTIGEFMFEQTFKNIDDLERKS